MTHNKNDWLLSLILDEINKSNKTVGSKSIDKVAQKIVSTIIPQYADLMLKNIRSNLEDILNKKRTYARQFEEHLLQRWKKPIDLLEVLVELCVCVRAPRDTHTKTLSVFRGLISAHIRCFCNSTVVNVFRLPSSYPRPC